MSNQQKFLSAMILLGFSVLGLFLGTTLALNHSGWKGFVGAMAIISSGVCLCLSSGLFSRLLAERIPEGEATNTREKKRLLQSFLVLGIGVALGISVMYWALLCSEQHKTETTEPNSISSKIESSCYNGQVVIRKQNGNFVKAYTKSGFPVVCE